MKYLALLFCLISFGTQAQTTAKFDGVFEQDCERYMLERLVARDTMFGNIPAELLRPGVNTLFVKKNALTDKLPDSIGGYRMRYVDPKADAKEIYRALKDSTASMLYMSNLQAKYAYSYIYLMPMYMVKKGRKITPEYTGRGCKSTFFFDFSKSRYTYDRSMRF